MSHPSSLSRTVPSQKLADIYSYGLLAPLTSNHAYLPFTTSSMRPYCLVHILNDVIVNRRARILEFGAGVSTVLLARLIRSNRLDARVTSVEHDPKWSQLVTDSLRRDDTSEHADVLTIPLTTCTLAKDDNLWYDSSALDAALAARKFDMVVVDGPPAWERGRERARYPALPYVQPRLAEAFSFYLDDAERDGEQRILKEWACALGANFVVAGGTLACHRAGAFFNTEPIDG